MSEVKNFVTPREIVWGRGSLSHLEKIVGKRAIIVTDKADRIVYWQKVSSVKRLFG